MRQHSRLPTLPTEEPQYAMSFPPPEAEESGGGLSVLQIWHMFRAHLWLGAAIFVLLAALAFAVIKWLIPASYQATAALIVNTDVTDPLAGKTGQTYLPYTFFPTQVELINNNVVLRPVVERLKLQADRRFNGGFVGAMDAVNEIVLMNLRASLHVQPGANSQLLYISATASDPVQAADIANAVSDEYLRQASQRSDSPAIERAKRYSAQLAELKAKVEQAQARVADFRAQHGMADLKQGMMDDQEGLALADLQVKLLEAQNARRQLESQSGNASAESSAALGGPESAASSRELESLESQMGLARTTLGPQHPRVLQLQSQIDATRNSLRSSTRVRLAAARELEARYQAAFSQERTRLLERRGLQDEGAKLLLEAQAAAETYSQALRGADQVQFASAGNYKDVALVSRAEPPLKPSKPNKTKLFAAALAACLALAFGGPFAYELFLNRRIRCRDDLERHFGVVMLARFGAMDPAPGT